jgi:Flp pilus assembly pilin Flp
MLLTAHVFVSALAASFLNVVRPARSSSRGQGLAEYALILALIAIVAIVALLFLGGQVSKILSTVGKSV